MKMGKVYTEGKHSGEFMLSEGNGTISREEGVLAASAAKLAPGTLLGKVTASGKLVAYSNAAGDGSEQAIGILYHGADDVAVDQKVAYIARNAEVIGALLTGLDTPARSELAALGIVIR